VQVLKGRRHMVQHLAFSRCGRWLVACGSSGGLHVWDTADPTAKPAAFPQLHPAAIAFRDDGLLFAHVYSGSWYLFDPATNELDTIKAPRTSYVVPSPDGRRVVRIHAASPICTWAVTPEGAVPDVSVKRGGANVFAAAFAPDGSAFATFERFYDAHFRPTVELTVRRVADGKPICSPTGAPVSTEQLAFSHDGARLFGRWTASVGCWDLAEPDKLRKAVNPARRHFVAMAVHPNGQLLTVDNDRLVRVWEVPALTADRTITWNVGKLYAVAVSRDGTRAAVGSHTGKVLVWDWD
jgi:WD40 repeat protein